jgi:hypothetical protein
MTIEVGAQKVGRVGRRGGKRPATSLPIGEVDANIFACPACNRPLGSGTSRCPSCNTRLVGGVKASRVAIFVGIGLFSGMIVSGALMGIASVAGARPAAVPVVQAPPIVTPTQAPVPSVAVPVVDPGITSGAISALRQSTRLNQRVVADAERLATALAASKPSSSVIAPILRSMATNASFGARLAPTVGEWSRASAVSEDLAAFYAAISSTAQQGLSASLSSSRAYEAAAEQMLQVVAGLDDIDAASRALAAGADFELPPLVAPSS